MTNVLYYFISKQILSSARSARFIYYANCIRVKRFSQIQCSWRCHSFVEYATLAGYEWLSSWV